MRIISGTAGGRSLQAVSGRGTRPTSDKVKEAIFSRIGPYFSGGTVLDLFAGTGALGIEAISRGMDRGIFVDRDPKAVAVVKANLAAAGFTDHAEVYRNDADRALSALAKRDLGFDLVFLDPPYRLKNMHDILEKMEAYHLLREEATIVLEHAAEAEYPGMIGAFRLERRSDYGDTAVSYYIYLGHGK